MSNIIFIDSVCYRLTNDSEEIRGLEPYAKVREEINRRFNPITCSNVSMVFSFITIVFLCWHYRKMVRKDHKEKGNNQAPKVVPESADSTGSASYSGPDAAWRTVVPTVRV